MSFPGINHQEAQDLARAEERSLTPPAAKEHPACCNGTGVKPGTEMADYWGMPCDEGCEFNIHRIRELLKKPSVSVPRAGLMNAGDGSF